MRVFAAVSTVGQAFGCKGVLRDVRGKVVEYSEHVRPYGFAAAAIADAEELARVRQHTLVSRPAWYGR